MSTNNRVAVILMTYGSPKHARDVPAYLRNIYGGREPGPEAVAEFQRRYALIGGSPLIEMTERQAAALEKELNRSSGGCEYTVAAGMRFSPPLVADVVRTIFDERRDSVETRPEDAQPFPKTIVGIILSPQYSPIIMSGYARDLRSAVDSLGRADVVLSIAKHWHDEPYFIRAVAERVEEALDRLPNHIRGRVPVLFSAHSMPKRVVDREPEYVRQLEETAVAVADAARLPRSRWLFCYQSAGHMPQEWLKPDFVDIMPGLRASGKTHALIAPVQFLSDHLEILYDIDIAAREQAESNGIAFSRTESLNTSPLFITALANVVRTTIAR